MNVGILLNYSLDFDENQALWKICRTYIFQFCIFSFEYYKETTHILKQNFISSNTVQNKIYILNIM